MILSQNNTIAQAVISNGLITGNEVQNPNNLLNTTDSTALFGPTSDVIIGNFPFSLPLDAVIVGIKGVVRAQITNNSVPPGSLTPVLLDGVTQYPGTPVTGISAVLADYDIGGEFDVWGNTSWTPTKINNLQVGIIGNSAIEAAWVSMTVYYYIPQTVPVLPPFTLPGCEDCDSEIQALPFELAEPWLTNQDYLILKKFNLPDENQTPITMNMIGDCGGTINLTVDPDLSPEDGGNFIENFNLQSGISSITNQPNGTVRLDLGNINLRGLGFVTPYGHDAARISEHAAGAVVIITNNGPWNSKLLKRCHIGTLVSAPQEWQDEGTTVAVSVDKVNVRGDNAQVSQDPIDPQKVNVDFVSSPSNILPEQEDHNEATTGTTPATTLNVPLTIASANYLRVWISAQIDTIVSVEYDGVAMSLVGSKQNPSEDVEVFLYELINPNVGANDVVITFTNAINFSAGANSYLDVDTANPTGVVSTGAIGTDDAPTDSITTLTENELIQDVVGTTNNPTVFTQSGLFTINGDITAAARPGATSTRRVLLPGLVVDTYSLDVITPWAMIIAGIRGNTTPVPVAGISSINGDTTSAQVLNNADGLITITQPVPGTNRFAINLTNLVTALLGSASFISGLISNLINNLSFINGLTSNATFQANVLAFTGGGGGGGGSGGCGSSKLVQDMTSYNFSAGSGGVNPIYTEVIPGGTLGTSYSIRVTLIGLRVSSGASGADLLLRLKYGGSTIATLNVLSGAGTFSNYALAFNSIIAAKNSANAQESTTMLNGSTTGTISAINELETANTLVDSTINQNLELEWEYQAGAAITLDVQGILVEKIAECGGSFNPATSFTIFEDFITNVNADDSGLTSENKVGSIGMYVNNTNGGGGSAAIVTGDADHPGVLSIGGGNGDVVTLQLKKSFFDFRNYINGSTLEIVTSINTLSTNGFIGYNDSASWTNTDVHYLGFELVSTGASTIDVTGKYYDNSGSPVTTSTIVINKTDYYKFTIEVDDTGANASFYVDGVLLGTIAISTWSVAITPGVFGPDNSWGTPNNKEFRIDYFALNSDNITR